MSNPHVTLDPDPLHVDDPIAHAHELNEIWEQGYAAAEGDRRYRLLGLVLAGISGAIMGAVIAVLVVGVVYAAAPRPDPERPDPSGRAHAQGQAGAPLQSLVETPSTAEARAGSNPAPVGSGAPSDAELGTAMVGGTLAYASRSFGPRYLAIPEGPGVHVRICSQQKSNMPARCLDRVSNDAGPALFRQREGRLADVSFVDFAWLCRCDPPSLGLLRHATIEYLGNGPATTPPPTDTDP